MVLLKIKNPFKISFFILINSFLLSLNSSNKNSEIIWETIEKPQFNLEIKWEPLKGPYKIKNYQNKNIEVKNFQEEINYKINNLNQIEPHLPLNNFLKKGSLDSTIQWKSSFSGGESGGTGQQNNSFRIDYGLSNNDQISFYFSEADDNLYYKINNQNSLTPYNWQNIGISLKNKFFRYKESRSSLSIVSTIEYMKITSGSEFSKSIFNKLDENLGRDKFVNLIGSFSLPFNYDINKKVSFALTPGVTLLPDKLGNRNEGKNNYGKNFYVGSGFIFNFSDDLNLSSSITHLIGPGDNYFDKSLNYRNVPLYSFGIIWEPSPLLSYEGKITNSFGGTPSTGILTIPSANIPLYYLGFTYKGYQEDIILKPLTKTQSYFSQGGLSLENPNIPFRGSNQTGINFDSKGNLFLAYSYSLSNVFQIDLLNIGRFNNRNNFNLTESRIRDRYLNNYNTNYRLGGKFLLFSPKKGDNINLASKISVGRNDTTNQGYIFSELINASIINEKIALNLNPKYLWSGDGTLGGLGFGLQYKLHDNLQFIPEYNLNISDNENSNFTLGFRYSRSSKRWMDFYISNAEGMQDIGELLKSKDVRFGFKFNAIY